MEASLGSLPGHRPIPPVHHSVLPLLSTQPELCLPLDWPPAHSVLGFALKLGDWSEKRRKSLVEAVVRYMAQERQRVLLLFLGRTVYAECGEGQRSPMPTACCTPRGVLEWSCTSLDSATGMRCLVMSV